MRSFCPAFALFPPSYPPLVAAGRSNALNIASRLGLDPTIIDAARRRLAVGVSAANEAIEELEGAQGELQQADVALFAVEGVKQDTKVRWGGSTHWQGHCMVLLQ